MKEIWILRHGQATHNPRAEAAKDHGCTFDEFLELMRQDDSLDSPLTELGEQQARTIHQQYFAAVKDDSLFFDWIVSSPLSRALRTADLAFPPDADADADAPSLVAEQQRKPRRVCCEYFREINGWLLNAQRRTKSELKKLYPHWSFDDLEHEQDSLWNPVQLESMESCRQRGYLGLQWLLQLPSPPRSHRNTNLEARTTNTTTTTNNTTTATTTNESTASAADFSSNNITSRILLVCHGGILRQTMVEYPECVEVRDARTTMLDDPDDCHPPRRPVTARFGNAELRRYLLHYDDEETETEQSKILLKEVDFQS